MNSFATLRSVLICICSIGKLHAYDVRLAIVSPFDGSGFEGEFPVVDVDLSFGQGPVADAARQNPRSFELCIDFDARGNWNRTAAGHGSFLAEVTPTGEIGTTEVPASVYCKGLMDSAEFGRAEGTPSDGVHTVRAWLRSAPGQNSELEKLGDYWWVEQGAFADISYITSPSSLQLRVISPIAGCSYGGYVVAAQLEWAAPADYVLCLNWDAGVNSSTANCVALEDSVSSPPSDSPSPEDMHPGPHIFMAWLERRGGVEGPVLAVQVPYSTYTSQHSSQTGSLLKPVDTFLMTDNQVKSLWERLGLGFTMDESLASPALRERAGARARAMGASLDPDARIDGLDLPRNAKAILSAQLYSFGDFARVLTACDFAEWMAMYNFSRPSRMLLTDPRDVEVSLLHLDGMYRATYTYIKGGRTLDNIPSTFPAVFRPGVLQNTNSKHLQSMTVFSYDPAKSVGDLHSLLHKTDSVIDGEPFDLAIMSQTLEHLIDPVIEKQQKHTFFSRLYFGKGPLHSSDVVPV